MTALLETPCIVEREVKICYHFRIEGEEDWVNEMFSVLANRELHQTELEGLNDAQVIHRGGSSAGDEYVTVIANCKIGSWVESYSFTMFKDDEESCDFQYLG